MGIRVKVIKEAEYKHTPHFSDSYCRVSVRFSYFSSTSQLHTNLCWFISNEKKLNMYEYCCKALYLHLHFH